VLQALAPNLQELRFGASHRSIPTDRELLARVAEALPNLTLSALSARPTLVSSEMPDIGQHIIVTCTPFREDLILLLSDDPSLQPLSTASLTRLHLIDPTPGLHHQPMLFLASSTTQIRELHLDFRSNQDAHVVPVAALPPHLTGLFCTFALLQLDGHMVGAVPNTPPIEASRAAAAANAACSTSQCSAQHGLQQLRTLMLHFCNFDSAGSTPNTFVGGGRLPDLLQRTPNLERLVFRHRPGLGFHLGSAGDAARLRGCCQMLTHLEMSRGGFPAAERQDADGEEQLCEWVRSLRHLRQLCMEANYIPGPLVSRVSCMTPSVFALGFCCRGAASGADRERHFLSTRVFCSAVGTDGRGAWLPASGDLRVTVSMQSCRCLFLKRISFQSVAVALPSAV
jgi:hypothetical protein